MHPPPGKATEKDVIAIREGPERRLCELVDGVLVEKAMGTRESFLAAAIIGLMDPFVTREDLGIVLGADGMLRLWPGQVRIPDVSFISWERLPNEEVPEAPVAALVPDLAVEVLSRGNTKKEIDRKLRDYFKAGVRLAWVIQPKTQTAEVYTSPTKPRRAGKDQSLDGGDVLPGFTLSLKDLFARTKRRRRR
jgi:Uma2 family endonuclease